MIVGVGMPCQQTVSIRERCSELETRKCELEVCPR